jgi:hypothetical protein
MICFLSLVLVLFLIGCSKRESFPKVSFIALEAVEGAVSFKATSSNADTYLWDFGDGYSIDVEDRAIFTHITKRMLLHIQQRKRNYGQAGGRSKKYFGRSRVPDAS